MKIVGGDKMVSVIGSFYTLSKCIDILGVDINEFKALNENQKNYLDIYRNCKGANIPEIESKVDIGRVDRVNSFLSERGFDIGLNPIEPNDIAIASILELLLSWLEIGEKTTIRYKDNTYTGVDLPYGVNIRNVQGFIYPAAIVDTKNGDKVWMTVIDSIPNTSFEVFNLARKLISSPNIYPYGYKREVIFPMIDLDMKPDISWLVGLGYRRNYINQALQQTKVKMDEKGVTIKEAVAIAVTLACVGPITVPLVINRPFLFVVEREGLKEPLFSAYLDVDYWIKK